MLQPEDAYVLVIEDDQNNLLVVTDFLLMAGVQHIYSETSGKRGIELALSLPQLDIILLDIQLPNEDGYQILQRIRQNPKIANARVIAVTANVLPQDDARALQAGFDGFIGKPLDFDRFPEQIQAILRSEKVWYPR